MSTAPVVKPPTMDPEELLVRKWLIHSLNTYPLLSKSLLNATMMSCTSRVHRHAWQDVLLELVHEGLVNKVTRTIMTPNGRAQRLELFELIPEKAQAFIEEHLPDITTEAG